MRPSTRLPVQSVVILGFVISALAAVISYFNTVTQQGYRLNGFKVTVIPLLNPLVMISVVIAWFWLTRVEPSDESGAAILRRSFLAFAAQYFFTTVLLLMIITPFNTADGFWLTTVLWFELIGATISTIGLILLSRAVTVRTPTTEPVEDSPALS
jgi:hypothetical protein